MTEPRKVTRWDPVDYCDQGSKGRGMMERDTDGDYVEYEDYRELEAETQELAEAAQKLLNELDGEAFFQVGPPNAELLYTNAGNLRSALARHRAKQEVQS